MKTEGNMKKWVFIWIVQWYARMLIPIECRDDVSKWSIIPETDKTPRICVEKREGYKSAEFLNKEDALKFIYSRPDNSMGLEITRIHLREIQE
jgi:hypothetical protein